MIFGTGCCAADDLCYDNRRAFFVAHRDSLAVFAADLRSYGRIQSMSNGSRPYIELNGHIGQLDSTSWSTTAQLELHRAEVFASVFRRDTIQPIEYEHYRDRLARLGFVEVAVTPHFTAFLHDAFTDNGNGFLHVMPGSQPPSEGSALFDMMVVVVEEMAPGWYFFGTS